MVHYPNIFLRKLLQNEIIPEDSDEQQVTETIIIQETEYVTIANHVKTKTVSMINRLTTSALNDLQEKSRELFHQTAKNFKSIQLTSVTINLSREFISTYNKFSFNFFLFPNNKGLI